MEKLEIITVASIKKKHLDQVCLIPYNWSSYKAVIAALLAEHLVVRYWFFEPSLKTNSQTRLWLIEGPKDGNLQKMIPPDNDNTAYAEVCDKYKDIPQLFVD